MDSSGVAEEALATAIHAAVLPGRRLLLIDDVDELTRANKEWGSSPAPTVVSSLIQGIKSCSSLRASGARHRRLFVVATCTSVDRCDPELLLPHVLGASVVQLRNPDQAQREALAGRILRMSKQPSAIDLHAASRDIALRWKSLSVAYIGKGTRECVQSEFLHRAVLHSLFQLGFRKHGTFLHRSSLASCLPNGPAVAEAGAMADALMNADENYFPSMVASSSPPAAAVAVAQDHDLVNLDTLQHRLRSTVLWPLQRSTDRETPASPSSSAPSFCSGVLIHGPSGSGKTALSHWLVAGSKLPFLSISCADLVNKAVGASERAIVDVFHAARKVAPCFLLLDNIEMVVGVDCPQTTAPLADGHSHSHSSRTSHAALDRILSTLLAEIDGLSGKSYATSSYGGNGHEESSGTSGVVVVATTNNLRLIDRLAPFLIVW